MTNDLFSKNCLKVVADNFEYFSFCDRNNLLDVLSVVAAECGERFYIEILAKKEGELKKDSKMKENSDDDNGDTDISSMSGDRVLITERESN